MKFLITKTPLKCHLYLVAKTLRRSDREQNALPPDRGHYSAPAVIGRPHGIQGQRVADGGEQITNIYQANHGMQQCIEGKSAGAQYTRNIII